MPPVSPRKAAAEPQLNREDFVKGHLQRFLAHVETREIGKDADKDSVTYGQQSQRSKSKSSSDESQVNKDNEDPNGKTEKKADQFDPKELCEEYDGWSLYKKTRISFAPVRRY